MSDGLNRATLIGHLGKDPELHQTQNSSVLKMSIACSEKYKHGDEWKERTEWITVVVWGKRADGLSKILGKGDRVCVEGRIQTDKWDDKEGTTRYATKVVATNVLLLGGGRHKEARNDPEATDATDADGSFDPNGLPF
jgi:single-strand DNA-binding protein